MNINYKSKLIPKIEKKYQIIKKENLTFAEIIDKHFKSLHSIDTISEELSEMLAIQIPRSTFVNAIKSEILKAENNISTLKYRPKAKVKNNPYRKKHKWNQKNRRVKNNWSKRKKIKMINIIFHCNNCKERYMDSIPKMKNNYGLRSYKCKKCKKIGNGFFIHDDKKIKIQKTKIKGVTEEIIYKNRSRKPR